MSAEQRINAEQLITACMELSQLTLDLVWALEWIDTLTDRLGKDGLVTEFMADLEGRCKSSRHLDTAAKEVELL